jgi:hypothetical protein
VPPRKRETASQQYRATIERKGRKRSPRGSNSLARGGGSSPHASPYPYGLHILAAELEHHEHLSSPGADPAHSAETGDDLLVRSSR